LDIDARITKLANTIPKIEMPKLNVPKPGSLFPKLEGPNKPPALTSESQPKLNVNSLGIPKLPTMRENGRDPLFSSEMKTLSPYQKN
jgi:hypothetical protein